MFQRLTQFLFAPTRPYPTTAPIHFQLKNRSLTNIWGWKPFSTVMYASSPLRSQHTDLDVNERIIEIPWIIHQLSFKKKGNVLDVGYLESSLGISLATAGFSVTGIDIRPADLSHPNFTALHADICKNTLPSNHFHYVILLSTLEHIGLETLYGKVDSKSSDQKAIQECLRVLKPGGTLLITTPVAKKFRKDSFMRVYTPGRLKKLLTRAQVKSLQFFAPDTKRQFWSEVTEQKLPNLPQFGVALISATKVK